MDPGQPHPQPASSATVAMILPLSSHQSHQRPVLPTTPTPQRGAPSGGRRGPRAITLAGRFSMHIRHPPKCSTRSTQQLAGIATVLNIHKHTLIHPTPSSEAALAPTTHTHTPPSLLPVFHILSDSDSLFWQLCSPKHGHLEASEEGARETQT